MWAGTRVPEDSACCADLPPGWGREGACTSSATEVFRGAGDTLYSRGTGMRGRGSRGAGGVA